MKCKCGHAKRSHDMYAEKGTIHGKKHCTCKNCPCTNYKRGVTGRKGRDIIDTNMRKEPAFLSRL